MAYAKNTKTRNFSSTRTTKASKSSTSQSSAQKSSSRLHTERPATQRARLIASRRAAARVSARSRHTIMVIIIVVALIVILTALFAAVATPEHTVKSKIESIAQDYYENYFYDQALSTTTATAEEVFQPYAERGFAKVPLRQLLLFDHQRHAAAASLLTQYCSEDATFLTFYPDPPYSKTDYHISYEYSCNF